LTRGSLQRIGKQTARSFCSHCADQLLLTCVISAALQRSYRVLFRIQDPLYLLQFLRASVQQSTKWEVSIANPMNGFSDTWWRLKNFVAQDFIMLL
jgi:hypothetical protein